MAQIIMGFIDEGKKDMPTNRRKMYEGTNRKARTLAAERRRKQVSRYYNYASIAFISGGVGIYLGIIAANWNR